MAELEENKLSSALVKPVEEKKSILMPGKQTKEEVQLLLYHQVGSVPALFNAHDSGSLQSRFDRIGVKILKL